MRETVLLVGSWLLALLAAGTLAVVAGGREWPSRPAGSGS